MTERKTYHGSCHCGAVRFEITTKLTPVIECNCSICSKKGALHHRVKPENFNLVEGKNELVLYQFDSKEAKHLFCRHCGIHAFSHPRAAPDMININVRCLDDVDLQTAEFELVKFDGQNWEQNIDALRARLADQSSE